MELSINKACGMRGRRRPKKKMSKLTVIRLRLEFCRQIGDFGTPRWAQNTENSTGLATYTTKTGQSTHISFAWTAPEVR